MVPRYIPCQDTGLVGFACPRLYVTRTKIFDIDKLRYATDFLVSVSRLWEKPFSVICQTIIVIF